MTNRTLWARDRLVLLTVFLTLAVPFIAQGQEPAEKVSAEHATLIEAIRAVPAFLDSNASNHDVALARLQVAVVAAEGPVEPLIDLLRHPNAEARTWSLQTLDLLGPHAELAVPALAELLGQEDVDRQETELALLVLRDLGESARDARPVVEALLRRGGDLPVSAAEALTAMGGDAVTPLIEALGSGDASSRASAAECLRVLDRAAAPALSALRSALRDADDLVRYRAAMAIWMIDLDGSRTLPIVREFIRDGSAAYPQLRGEALTALRLFATEAKSAVPDIVALLEGESLRDAETLAALETLGEIGPFAKVAAPTVAAALDDADWQVRAAAAVALWGIERKPDRSVAVLLELLADSSENRDEIRAAAARGLGRIGADASAAVPALIAQLGDASDNTVRMHSAQALGFIGPAAAPAIPDMIELLADPAAGLWVGNALAGIGEAAVPALEEAAASGGVLVRGRANRALQRIRRAKR